MYLKSIELSGFKSFAKKSELTFSSPISAIVGPNGSGKSNIAEAFRFVLGEQSIKSLRGKKGEDLIFNGAGDLPRGNRASVKVVFDNAKKDGNGTEQRIFPIDFETVTIERIVHRDSVNEYLINGSSVRLKDVVELLGSANIGASGHHIISQGEADRILNASIKERKSMIEDALGLKMYQYKKTESERKLAKTRDNIAHVESLRREIMPHIKFLKKQVEKVEKGLEMKKDLESKASEYCVREREYIEHTKTSLSAARSTLESSLHTLENELNAAKKVLEKSTHKDAASHELIELEKNLHTIREEKDTAFRELGKLDGELSSLVRMVKKQEDIAKTYASKTVPLVSVEALLRDIEQKILNAKTHTEAEQILHAMDSIARLLSDFIDHHKDKVDMSLMKDTEKEIAELGRLKDEIETSVKKIRDTETALASQYAKLKNDIEMEKDSNRDAEKAVFRVMAEEQEIRSKLHSLTSEEETLRIQSDDFKRELSELGMMLGPEFGRRLRDNSTKFESEEEFGRAKQEERRRAIEKIKIRLEDAGLAGGEDVLKEYTAANERDEFLVKELTDLEASAQSLTALIADLETRLSTEFNTGVEKINKQFREYFALMFGGGSAELMVVNEPKKKRRDTDDLMGEDPDESTSASAESFGVTMSGEAKDGIDIDVSLPKKKVKGLMMLSGGERALTSIALLFAVSQVNPPPFIILDETDAALDEANSKKYADMIESLGKFSQLIVITHNRETMSRAGVLYGVTMGMGGGSKLLSVAFDEAVAVAK